jgi:hypothetical protein
MQAGVENHITKTLNIIRASIKDCTPQAGSNRLAKFAFCQVPVFSVAPPRTSVKICRDVLKSYIGICEHSRVPASPKEGQVVTV